MHGKYTLLPFLSTCMKLTSLCSINGNMRNRYAQKTGNATAEYLLASRQMTLVPTTLSLACSFISAITLLGTPSEMYVEIKIAKNKANINTAYLNNHCLFPFLLFFLVYNTNISATQFLIG